MKKTLLTALSAGFLWSSLASAALPPYWESVRELKEILADNKIASLFTSGRAIVSIDKAGDGYDISSDSCTLHVTVKHVQAGGGMVGPGKLELVVPDSLDCR